MTDLWSGCEIVECGWAATCSDFWPDRHFRLDEAAYSPQTSDSNAQDLSARLRRGREEIDFLVEAMTTRGTRWLAIEAKLAVQNVSAVSIPKSLAREGLGIQEVWVVSPAGAETRLAGNCLQIPIIELAERLEQVFA